MKKLLYFFAALAASLQPANATIIVVDFHGNFTSGSDLSNYFGLGTDLSGAAVHIQQTFDDSAPGTVHQSGTSFFGDDQMNGFYGFGPDYGGIKSPGSSSFTVNGITVNLAGRYGAGLQKHMRTQGSGFPPYQQFISNVSDDSVTAFDSFGQPMNGIRGDTTIYVSHPHIFTSLALDEDFTFTGDTEGEDWLPYYQGGIYFEKFNAFDYAGYQFGYPEISIKAGVVLTGATFSVHSTSNAVPEPTTWAMLVTGIGLIGLATRRRTLSPPPLQEASVRDSRVM